MRVLFVARSGDLRGDNQVLLTFLRWLHDDDIEPVVVLGEEGALLPEFERVAETYVFPPASKSVSASSVPRRAYNAVMGARREAARRRFRKRLGAFDLVYVNGLGGAAPVVNGLGITNDAPILTHLHEQSLGLRLLERETGEARRFIRRTDRFITVSASGAAALCDQYDVAESSISIVFPFIDVDAIAIQRSTEDLRALAGIPDDAFVVGGAGTAEWLKGPDLFVQVARDVARRDDARPVAFVWVGKVPEKQRDRIDHDIAGLGVDTVHFIGEHANGPALFREFDVLCMPSHEDPFACVFMESAVSGVPSVRFRAGDGREVFGSHGGAVVVDYLDVAAMGAAIAGLAADPARLRALGDEAQKCAQDFDVRVAGPRVVDAIKQTVGDRARPG